MDTPYRVRSCLNDRIIVQLERGGVGRWFGGWGDEEEEGGFALCTPSCTVQWRVLQTSGGVGRLFTLATSLSRSLALLLSCSLALLLSCSLAPLLSHSLTLSLFLPSPLAFVRFASSPAFSNGGSTSSVLATRVESCLLYSTYTWGGDDVRRTPHDVLRPFPFPFLRFSHRIHAFTHSRIHAGNLEIAAGMGWPHAMRPQPGMAGRLGDGDGDGSSSAKEAEANVTWYRCLSFSPVPNSGPAWS
jgi:hypothetical protein